MTSIPTFSILTPTYNRAHLLPRVFAGLQSQTVRDFEWIVVDDGSSDGTSALVAQLAAKADFPVRYLYQENSGKHVAVNRGVAVAKGTFIGIMDSDDYYKPNALERFLVCWNEIPESRRNEFVGVTALVDYADGRVVGTKFPADVLDSDTIECHWKYGVTGDKKGFQRADVLREFPFPEDLGRYVTEALVWNRIAMRYRTRFVNEIWATVEYLKDGLSTRNNSLRIASPKATFLQLAELIASGGRLPFRARVLASASLLRFALHARRWSHCEVIPRSCLPFAIPLGVAVFLRDRIRFG